MEFIYVIALIVIFIAAYNITELVLKHRERMAQLKKDQDNK
jgi:hypothetical protein